MGDKNNTWLTDQGEVQIDFYVDSKDIFLVERERTLKLLTDIFGYHFSGRSNLKILDLGCGEGEMTLRLAGLFPGNNHILMDGSAVMLEKAENTLKGRNYEFKLGTFEEFSVSDEGESSYDFIFSSMAIHHLCFDDKAGLYARIFRALKSGGIFLNIDQVLPSSDKSDDWQMKMWRDWMKEKLDRMGRSSEYEKFEKLPESAKAKPENKPSGLFDQLEVLRKAGFRNTDCFYKYGMFALFGGTK